MKVSQQPNILLLFPDQWRSDSLSCLGHPVAWTPHLDQLASEGVIFTNAYSNCPICIPARAGLITGQTPRRTGRHGYRDGVEWRYSPTLMSCLRDAGYQTMLSGKSHFFPNRACLGFEQMEVYDTQAARFGETSDYALWLARETGGRVRDTAEELGGNAFIARPWTAEERLHPSVWTTERAMEMIAHRDPQRPFFLQVGYNSPHPPFNPPMEFFHRLDGCDLPPVPVGDWVGWADHREYRQDASFGKLELRILDASRRAYFSLIAHVDAEIGRLLWFLRNRGLYENTLIVFSSDHGEHLGDHCLYRKGSPLESSAGVPLVVRLPGRERKPGTVDAPVALHDLMPTMLDAAGVPIPESVEGRSLIPLAAGNPPDPAWREWVHMEMLNPKFGNWQALTDGREKFVWDAVSGRELLFDLSEDPQECRNLAAGGGLSDRLATWRERLAAELSPYEKFGLVKAGKLNPGNRLPVCEDFLLL